MVRLDWVSTEDGSHILTAGVATNIYMYTQVSLDPALQNVALMKDSESTLRRPSLRKASSLIRWVCTRVLELDSADGLPPIPTTLSWARDGLLIVGMHSEMRVYNQWNLHRKNGTDAVIPRKKSSEILTVAISQSHLMLDQLQRKKDVPVNKGRLLMDLVNKGFPNKDSNSSVLEALSGEGLFETARLASPILPQYHPKQLIVLLNAGKTKRVKAILLNVLIALKQRQVSVHNPLSRAASMRRMSTVDIVGDGAVEGGQVCIFVLVSLCKRSFRC
uniref:Rav1p_C domain-containing protein n=1 Tax=Angiostrongylus cantonensis TaxID=6313 RepID=A0A0K0DNK0_ANGCA